MNQRSIVSWHVVSIMYQNCFSIKEMKKQTGGRMMKTTFILLKKRKEKNQNVMKVW
jgi:hypothetical protein